MTSTRPRAPRALSDHSVSRRPAFTLVEIMIAMTLFSILGAAAVTLLIKQTRAVASTAGRLDAQQNLSFAMDAIDHDLRVAGVGLGRRQPMILEANANAVTFNADLVTKDTASVTAASYYDPSVPDSLALALTPATQIKYPFSVVVYPDSTYVQSTGLISNAETISFYVTLDSTSTVGNDYLVLRRVNSAPPTLVARGLVLPGGAPVFRYFIPGANPNSRLELTAAQLPLYFKEGTVASDTLLAKISEVRVQLAAQYIDPLGRTVTRTLNQWVPLLNAGLAHISECNSPPAAPVSVTPTAAPSGDSIKVSWPASTDETGGKKTVNSYSVYRRVGTSGSWLTPIYTSPADGVASYVWQDKSVPLGKSYQYGVVARDCTPALSALTTSATATPNP
jgi:prepilin-type N-terminal cleavage/methylation domain-containing protein